MQYLVSVIDDKTGSAPDEMVAVDAFNDRVANTWPPARSYVTTARNAAR